jgi:hypothetical protein
MRLYWPRNWIVRLLLRMIATCPFVTRPKRYSSPITAPESMPKKSANTSPKSSFNGRVKRCVTRKALLKVGNLSEVGRPTRVKSGSASFRAAGSSACARAVEGASRRMLRPNTAVQPVSRVTLSPIEEGAPVTATRRR